MALDPKVWGPHYWFVLHTIALNYPLHPNETSKKKYYDFIENLPLFLPVMDMGNLFNEMLDHYPVTPYLDSRESLIKWVHFIHNKINIYEPIKGKSYIFFLFYNKSMRSPKRHCPSKKRKKPKKIQKKIKIYSLMVSGRVVLELGGLLRK